jgi:hypothetical protein
VSTGLLYYYLTSLIAVLGVALGHDYLRPAPHALTKAPDVLAAFANWDGYWYTQIVQGGYAYDPHKNSNVAFFPAFPLLARLLASATGLRPDLALLLVAHLCLAGTFIVLAAYVQRRFPDSPPQLAAYTLLAFGLLPPTFFFRMAYSESLFLLCCALTLYGMQRRWPALALAALAGLATATRPVGVCLLLPLALHLWQRSPGVRSFGVRLLVLAPVACWGLLAYMAYQWQAFDEPLAFARTQAHWRVRPPVPPGEQVQSLLTLEPVRSVFDSDSACYWRRHERDANVLFSLHLANPIWWLLALGALGLGAWKRWLNGAEVLLAAGLLLVPYATRGHEMCMGAMARFAAAALPLYLVLGRLLAALPVPAAAAVLSVSGFLMGAYAALFAAWYRFF